MSEPSPPISTDKHTPGPWWVERRVGDALQVNARHRGEGSSYCVASINHWEGDADKANARLIAAAPDMKGVLDDLEDAIDKQLYDERMREELEIPLEREYSVNLTERQIQAITRALNKAEHGS